LGQSGPAPAQFEHQEALCGAGVLFLLPALNVIKMICCRAESAVASLVAHHLNRADEEIRMFGKTNHPKQRRPYPRL